jgi:glycogen debranching enzyme
VNGKLRLHDGTSLFSSAASGDIAEGEGDGYFHRDVRHLSTWRLLVNGGEPLLLSGGRVTYYAGRVEAAVMGSEAELAVRRDRFVTDGIHEDLDITNLGRERRELRVELRLAADFADVLEAQQPDPDVAGAVAAESCGSTAVLRYERDGYVRETHVRFGEACEIDGVGAVFRIVLEPRESWHTCIDVVPVVNGTEEPPLITCDSFDEDEPELPIGLPQWLGEWPDLEGGSDGLRQTYRESRNDLASLRVRGDDPGGAAFPAGGIPWYLALFGRDSIITSYAALPFQPRLAAGTLEALADRQATVYDDFRDAEPGKILHELREGTLVALGDDPHGPYYGTHDATSLFVMLLDEYERWTGDGELVQRLEPAARAALGWIEGPGDPDGDGFLEYQSRSRKGLDNLCWKDSDGSIVFADGRVASPPIATCEVQGYAYDARLRLARLAREFFDDPALAERLERDAAALRDRFNHDFWSERRGHYVLALDREKRQVDSLTSNIGHLLWSGIADGEKAAATAEALLRDDLFSGWGVRTLATGDGGYNPLVYHRGTVWPHDTGIVAEGLRRYGYRAEAARLAGALLEAADALEHRLPEVFGGFARDDGGLPVRYPGALTPQAWAAAAPLLALRTLLGLDAVDGELRCEPLDEERFAGVRLAGMRFRGERVDVPPGRRESVPGTVKKR